MRRRTRAVAPDLEAEAQRAAEAAGMAALRKAAEAVWARSWAQTAVRLEAQRQRSEEQSAARLERARAIHAEMLALKERAEAAAARAHGAEAAPPVRPAS